MLSKSTFFFFHFFSWSLFSLKALLGKVVINTHILRLCAHAQTALFVPTEGWVRQQFTAAPSSGKLVKVCPALDLFCISKNERMEKLWKQFQGVDIVHCCKQCSEQISWSQCNTGNSSLLRLLHITALPLGPSGYKKGKDKQHSLLSLQAGGRENPCFNYKLM